MKKQIVLSLVMILSMLAIGCMDVSREILIKKDGSGTITNTVIYTKDFLMTMESFNKNKKDPNAKSEPIIEKFRNKEKLAEEAVKMGEGVTLQSVSPIELEDGNSGYTAVYTFTDINKIKIGKNPSSPMDKNSSKNTKPEIPYTFQFKNGDPNSLIINIPPSKKTEPKKKPQDKNQQNMNKMMIKMFKGFRITITLKVDGKITKTNATHVNENQITLLMMDIGKIVEDEKLLKKFMELGQINDISIVQEKMKKIPYIKAENKRKVTINFK